MKIKFTTDSYRCGRIPPSTVSAGPTSYKNYMRIDKRVKNEKCFNLNWPIKYRHINKKQFNIVFTKLSFTFYKSVDSVDIMMSLVIFTNKVHL